MATSDRINGTGFVKAQPAAPSLFSSDVYGAQAGLTFITSEWKFTGIVQNGSVTVNAQLQNLKISSPAGMPAIIQAWFAMDDFNPDGTIYNSHFTKLASATTSHTAPIQINNSTNWNWITDHLYRGEIYVIAAGAGARTLASSAQADFALNSIVWEASVTFPTPSGVYCKDGNRILYSNTSIILAAGQPISIEGCLGSSNANTRANVTLTDPNNKTIDLTPTNGIPIDSVGNFSASISAPKLPNGPYLVSVDPTTGKGPNEIIDFTLGLLPASVPTLPSENFVPILAVLALIPVITRRSRRIKY